MLSEIQSPRIAICLATYQRAELLEELLASLGEMEVIPGVLVELRIVDNDCTGSAQKTVDRFREMIHPFTKIHYQIESEQNIACARNASLEVAPADAVIFIDDDETVSVSWLTNLWKTYQESGADAVFGPVFGRCSSEAPGWIRRGNFFDKIVPPTGTEISWKETRTSNTLVRGHWFYGDNPIRFDKALGRSGGEDCDLFSRMALAGARFVSCQEAVVSEDVPPVRARFKWLWARWYTNGLIYERIATRMPEERHPFTRLFRRIGASILMSVSGLPSAIIGKPEFCFKGFFKLSLGLGGFTAWIRPEATVRRVAYKANSERKVDASSGKMRVAFLVNIISPYRQPVFERLAKIPGWDLRVFVNAEREFDRTWKVEESDLKIKRTACLSWKRTVLCKQPVKFKQVITLHVPFGLIRDLISFRPEKIISLELGFRTAIASLYCFVFRKSLVIWAYQSKVSSTQGRWRLLWRRFLLSRADRVIGMGKQARDVLLGWGVPQDKIMDALNAANDVALNARLSESDAVESIQNIRKAFAGTRRMAIIVGRLIPLKGIEHILTTWKALPDSTRSKWNLVFIGDGPLEQHIREQADPSVKLAGFVDSADMALWYAAADLHVFPTCGDVWGLVVNEASVCGTPSLCSVHAGCFDDLISDGENGLSIDFTQENAGQILDSALCRQDLNQLGEAARGHIAPFTLDNLAMSLRSAVDCLQSA